MSRSLSWCALAVLGGLLTASCVLAFDGEQAIRDDDDVLAPAQCVDDDQCVLAGPTCCECPTHALPSSSGWQESCANVDCMAPPAGAPTCTPLVARCDFGTCLAVCAPVACDLSCPQGFAADGSGCLTCACNSMPIEPTCQYDRDCVEVPADCCGCRRGGADIAVPVGTVDAYLASLECPADPTMGACPEVSTCDPSRSPRCLEGQCALLGPNDPGWAAPPPGACGRADLAPCPTGQSCVLNQSSEADPLGLGVCQPTP